MKQRKLPLKRLLILASFLVVVAAASLSVASATTRKSVAVSPAAALTWNTYAVNAVRASVPVKVRGPGVVMERRFP